jgi:hypothetical protein
MTPVFSGRAKLAISLAKYGVALCGVGVHSFSSEKERTKKAD